MSTVRRYARTPVLVQPGDRYGQFTVIEEAPRQRKPNGLPLRAFRCMCDCGREKVVRLATLREGTTVSCGCVHRQQAQELGKSFRTHGQSKTLLYRVWMAMKKRCHNPDDESYWRYGARGIQVCQEWRDSFVAFAAYVGERPDGLTLDRYPNPAGNYEPGNVRWATYTQQARNTRRNILVVVAGETMSLAEACERLNLPYSKAHYGVKRHGHYMGVQRV